MERPAVGPGRPRAGDGHQPYPARLGIGLREGIPDPGVERRHELDDDLLDDHRIRKRGGLQRHWLRPLRPVLWDRPRHGIRLLTLGIRYLPFLASRARGACPLPPPACRVTSWSA